MGVNRPIRSSVTEEIEADHVQAGRGQHARQRLLHPAGHQLARHQHDPGVAGAVLGELEPVAARLGLEEELSDPLRHQHADQPTVDHRSRVVARPAGVNWPRLARMSYSGRGLQGWPLVVVLIAAAYAVGVASVLFRPEASNIATWWPAAGIAVLVVALAPKQQRWLLGVAVLVVTAAANVTAGQD